MASCRVSHELGHFEESGDVAMPVDDSSGMGANPAQRVGIAQTYAKRYALLAILGISPEDDPDARGAGNGGGIQQPQRQSEPDQGEPERDTWNGTIKTVKQKAGETSGSVLYARPCSWTGRLDGQWTTRTACPSSRSTHRWAS